MKQNIRPSRLFTGFVKITGVPFTALFFKAKIIYEDKSAFKKAYRKPFILVSNHMSLLDFPLYMTIFFSRNIRFLMAEVLFSKNKLFSWFLYKLGGIYVDRNKYNTAFVGESLETLDKGQSIGVFPQGRVRYNNIHFPFKPGTAYIAMHTNAPIIPVYTDGNYGLTKRVTVVIGKELYISDYIDETQTKDEQLKTLTELIEKRVMELEKYTRENKEEKINN